MSSSTVPAEVKKDQHNPNISTNNLTLPRFSRSSHIADHMRAMHGAPKLQCNECEREFNGRSHLAPFSYFAFSVSISVTTFGPRS